MRPEPRLVCLAYVSAAEIQFDERSAADLAQRAEKRNRDNGVSGYLYYAKGRFLQYLEGDADALDELFDRLRRDQRHEILAVSRGPSLTERRFASWAMRFIRHTEIVGIGLETILSDQLLFFKRLNGEVGNLDESVWRLVDGIAQHISYTRRDRR